MFVYICIYTHTYTHIYIDIHIYIHTDKQIDIHTYIYKHVILAGIAKRHQWEIPYTGATGAIRNTRAIGGNLEAKSISNYCSKTFRFRVCLAGITKQNQW